MIKGSFCGKLYAFKSGNKEHGCYLCGWWVIDCCDTRENQQFIFFLNSGLHSNVIISLMCHLRQVRHFPYHTLPLQHFLMLSVAIQHPADASRERFVQSHPVQCPASFGAISSPRCDQHMKSTGLLPLPYASNEKSSTSSYARNCLNMIWAFLHSHSSPTFTIVLLCTIEDAFKRLFFHNLAMTCNGVEEVPIVKIIVMHDYNSFAAVFSTCRISRRPWSTSMFLVLEYFAAIAVWRCRNVLHIKINDCFAVYFSAHWILTMKNYVLIRVSTTTGPKKGILISWVLQESSFRSWRGHFGTVAADKRYPIFGPVWRAAAGRVYCSWDFVKVINFTRDHSGINSVFWFLVMSHIFTPAST